MSEPSDNIMTTTETLGGKTAKVNWHSSATKHFPTAADRQTVLNDIQGVMTMMGSTDIRDFWSKFGDVELQWQSHEDDETEEITVSVALFHKGHPSFENDFSPEFLGYLQWFEANYAFDGAPAITDIHEVEDEYRRWKEEQDKIK